MTSRATLSDEKLTLFFYLALALLLALRLTSIILTPLNLGPDEAQYWRWSETPAWGYYSKPPMVAWLIGITTSLFGHAEWAIRLASPIFHTGTALLLFLCGRLVWSPLTGIIAGLCWALMGGVWLSSTLISTDVPLLFFWSLSLVCLLNLRQGGGLPFAIGLGVALGLGFLSKYATIYFVIGLALASLYDSRTRNVILSLKGVAALMTFLALFGPHILWSMQNGFKTISHTADNARWDASLMNPENALKFFGDQFGVFSPVHFLLLLILFGALALSRTTLFKSDHTARVLLAFTLPPLLIILVQAFISRAHANWAASAYPAACLLIAVWTVHAKGWVKFATWGGFAANLLIGLVYTSALMMPMEHMLKLGPANASSKNTRAWPETLSIVQDTAKKLGATSIIVDDRENWHTFDYYGRDGVLKLPLKSWRKSGVPKSASEDLPITESDAANALLLIDHEVDIALMRADFQTSQEHDTLFIDIGGGKLRRFFVYTAQGFEPVER